ncbi:unnamed protein product [Urochloa decumbens]|uniref:Cytochrome P450 n=1 Tax=Urochloa decumbens TaxID=240449 RepID=A0ABC9EZH7_9POAL
MEGLLYLFLALLAPLLAAVVHATKRRRAAPALRLPPGPWELPVIGSLHHIAGRLPHRAMRDLARRHGPVMLLRVGEVPTLVVSSREAAREVMKTHDVAFASRPLSATLRAMTDGGRDIIFAPYGDRWRRLRKVAVVELLSARRQTVVGSRGSCEPDKHWRRRQVGPATAAAAPMRLLKVRGWGGLNLRALEGGLGAAGDPAEVTGAGGRAGRRGRRRPGGGGRRLGRRRRRGRGIHGEVAAMLRAAAARPAFDMRAALPTLVADTTMRAAVGDRCKHRDVLLRELERCILLAGGFNPADLWPSSRIVGRLSGAVGRATACCDAVRRVLDSIVDEHLERMDMAGDGNGGGGEVEDFLQVLLKLHKDGSLEIPINMDDIKHIIFDIFAGSETSSVVLEWAMAELIRNPRSMERAAAEVRRAFASRGAVDEDALAAGELRYLRHVVPVPRGTTVLVNAWALGRDERYWPGDPEEFRPERFEDDDAMAAVDLRGADFELVPFGAGRRMCPGMPFGLALVEHALAGLLLHFDWEVPGLADPAKLDMTEEFGITARRKNGLLLRPILRVPVPGL